MSKRPSGKNSSHRKLNEKKESNKEKKKKNISLSTGIHCTRRRHYTTTPRNPTLINNLQIFYLKHLPPENFGEKHALKLVEQFSGHSLSETLFTSLELGWLLLLMENYSLRLYICDGLIAKQMWPSPLHLNQPEIVPRSVTDPRPIDALREFWEIYSPHIARSYCFSSVKLLYCFYGSPLLCL